MPESMERGKQIGRKLEILRLLDNSHYGMTTDELHQEVMERVVVFRLMWPLLVVMGIRG